MIDPDQIEEEWYDNRPPPWWVGLVLPAVVGALCLLGWYLYLKFFS